MYNVDNKTPMDYNPTKPNLGGLSCHRGNYSVNVVLHLLRLCGQTPSGVNHARNLCTKTSSANLRLVGGTHVLIAGFKSLGSLSAVKPVPINTGLPAVRTKVRSNGIGKAESTQTNGDTSTSWFILNVRKAIATALSIDWCGKRLMGLFQRAMSSITSTVSRTITGWRTWKSCPAKSITIGMTTMIGASSNLKTKCAA